MNLLVVILMILAVIFLLMQGLQFNVKNIEIGWIGLFCWAFAVLIPMIHNLLILLLVIILLLIVVGAKMRQPSPVP